MKYLLLGTLCNVATVSGFAGFAEMAAFHPTVPSMDALNHAFTTLSVQENVITNPLELYTNSLKEHPLITKMATGGILSTCGDAIAQSQNDEAYDKKRAASFGLFDMMYRALQHATFPIIVAECHGQYMSGLFNTLGMGSLFADQINYMAAMEQTLASQLGIVPFLYYPVFFSLTGFLQGLSIEEAINRAKENFIPLMKRNLLFWIPVQFVQFGYIPTDLQIPFLSVCGLCWTFILSVSAGSVKGYSEDEAEEVMEIINDAKLDPDQQRFANFTTALIFEEAEQSVSAEKTEKEFTNNR